MSLRILFAIHGPADHRTAVFLTVSAHAGYLRQLGHRVDVFTPADIAGRHGGRLQPLALPVSLAGRALGAYDVVVFHSYLAWAYHLRRPPSDGSRGPATIVTFHGLEPLYHAAVAEELARTGERLSARFHLLHRVILPRLMRMACRRADAVFCLNSRERAFLLAERWVDPSRVALVANGVAAETLTLPRAYLPAAKRLLFVGQWLRAKGTRYLAAAFARLASEFPHAELTCAGTGAPARVVLEDFDPAVRSRVRVLQRFGREALAGELARADLFLFPSLSEGSSAALLEAMAAGLPIVATAAGAAPDILRDGCDAVLVPFADAGALAREAGGLMTDPVRRASLGAAARRTAREWTWEEANRAFAAEVLRVAADRP